MSIGNCRPGLGGPMDVPTLLAMSSPSNLVQLALPGARSPCVEFRWVGRPSADPAAAPPLMLFLHEGLGSVSMWRDFPDRLCAAIGFRGLVYSRAGYGRSTPRSPGETWAPDFMHRQADEVLPALLAALGVDLATQRPWLLGHSDGASIALIAAARRPAAWSGVVAMAPHILVEDLSIQSIRRAREAYASTDLRQRLARHHDDPDSAFFGWNDAWLSPAFRAWSIEAELPAIRCPVLAIQGLDDEYGTLEQVRGITRRVPTAQVLELPRCGHSPHRDQADAVVRAVQAFVHGKPVPSATA